MRADTLVISVAAGKTIKYIEEQFAGGGEAKTVKLVRCMPNTPALVLTGCTGFCVNEQVDRPEKEFAERLFSSFGKAIEVPERLMDTVGSVSGSSPAFVFMFIEALADGAVAEGMPRKQAIEFAAQAVCGSAKLVLESGKHPGELKDMVCSPGGTTIQGVRTLEKSGDGRGDRLRGKDEETVESKVSRRLCYNIMSIGNKYILNVNLISPLT